MIKLDDNVVNYSLRKALLIGPHGNVKGLDDFEFYDKSL